MNYIECKYQKLSRPLRTLTGVSGFEGPAAKTELDDGFGVPTMKGMLTPSYSCFYEETGRDAGGPLYDGTVRIPDTKANRYKIAMHVRSGDLRVKDRALETKILGDNPFVGREKAPRQRSIIAEMPEDFDGTKVVLKPSKAAMADRDAINDPHAQVSDGEFSEVPDFKNDPKAVAASDTPDKDVALVQPPVAISVAAVKAGGLPPQATSAPKGFDPKAMKERAAGKPEAAAEKTEETKVRE